MGAVREKDQADFDLERFVDLFDEAMTSQDPRVMKTLRDLMMIVALTRPESRDSGLHDRNAGPLRRVFEDMNHLNRRLHDIEDTIRRMQRTPLEEREYTWTDYEKYSMKAASQVIAAQVDQDVLTQMRAAGINKVKGLK